MFNKRSLCNSRKSLIFFLFVSTSKLYLKAGNKEKALNYAEKAVLLADQNPQIIDTYAQALAATQQFTLAIEQYDKALVIDSSNVELSINKAEALKLSNQSNKAKLLLMSIKTNKKLEQDRITQLLNGL